MNPFSQSAVISMLSCMSLVLVSFSAIPAASADDATGGDAVAELSVAPLDHVDYPLDRPPWIEDTGDHLDASDGSDVLIAVTSGPAPSPEHASELMEVMARGAVENYVERLARTYTEPIDPEAITIDMDWVRDELISRQYDGTVKTGDSVQYESACLIRLNGDHQERLNQMIQNHRLLRRLVVVGTVGVLSLLALLAGSIFFGWASSRQNGKPTPHPSH